MPAATVEVPPSAATTSAIPPRAAASDSTPEQRVPAPEANPTAEAATRQGADLGTSSKKMSKGVIAAAVVGGLAGILLIRAVWRWMTGKAPLSEGLGSLFKGSAATIPFTNAKSVATGAAAFEAFAAESATPFVGALGRPEHSARLLWAFSGIAPQVYLPFVSVKDPGGVSAEVLKGMEAGLTKNGLVMIPHGPDGVSIINLAAAGAVVKANADLFPADAQKDLKSWLTAFPQHVNGHQGHIFYGLLAGLPRTSVLANCAREPAFKKLEEALPTSKLKGTDLEKLATLLALKVRSPEQQTELGGLAEAAGVLSAEELQLVKHQTRHAPAGSPVPYEAFSVADGKWGHEQILLAQAAVAKLKPETQQAMKLTDFVAAKVTPPS